jgi:hypothetical protein
MDVCHVKLSLVDSFMNSTEGAAEVRDEKQVINIQQNNVFRIKSPRHAENHTI